VFSTNRRRTDDLKKALLQKLLSVYTQKY